jgi:hypothetical protein
MRVYVSRLRGAYHNVVTRFLHPSYGWQPTLALLLILLAVLRHGLTNPVSSMISSISQPTCTGCGIHFDGLNQWLTHGTTISAIMGTTVAAHTTVIYVKPNLANPAVPQTTDFKNVPATIIGSQDTAASSGLGITNINNQAEPIYGFMREDFKTLDEIHGTAPITGGQHMIAVTDALNEVGHLDDDIVLYVDGSVVANSNPGQRTSSRTISCIGGGFKVGNDFNSAANLFAGDIYEIIVFPKVLKPDQISCLNNYFVNHWHCR